MQEDIIIDTLERILQQMDSMDSFKMVRLAPRLLVLASALRELTSSTRPEDITQFLHVSKIQEKMVDICAICLGEYEESETIGTLEYTKATFCGLEYDAVEPFISLSKTLKLLYKSSKLRLSTPGLVLIIRETCDQAEGTDIQEKNKKKAKDKQIQARSGKGKVKSHQNEVIQLEGLKLPSLKLYYKVIRKEGPKLQTG
ncbi:hypothetical protein Tco_1275876 [Tanacetum coccineum]